jgi:hypothetical protein
MMDHKIEEESLLQVGLGDRINFFIRTQGAFFSEVGVSTSNTFETAKKQIQEGIIDAPAELVLNYIGTQLSNDRTLKYYDIGDKATLFSPLYAQFKYFYVIIKTMTGNSIAIEARPSRTY